MKPAFNPAAHTEPQPSVARIGGRNVRSHAWVDPTGQVYDTRRKGSGVGLVLLACLACLLFGGYLALRFMPMEAIGAASMQQALPTAGIAPRPTYPPMPTSDLSVLPYNATQEARATAYQATDTAAVSTPVPEAPTPTDDPAQFWTAEERAAMTATAVAWFDPATVPTAPAAFVDATLAGCADAEMVAESPYLQLWCPKSEGE